MNGTTNSRITASDGIDAMPMTSDTDSIFYISNTPFPFQEADGLPLIVSVALMDYLQNPQAYPGEIVILNVVEIENALLISIASLQEQHPHKKLLLYGTLPAAYSEAALLKQGVTHIVPDNAPVAVWHHILKLLQNTQNQASSGDTMPDDFQDILMISRQVSGAESLTALLEQSMAQLITTLKLTGCAIILQADRGTRIYSVNRTLSVYDNFITLPHDHPIASAIERNHTQLIEKNDAASYVTPLPGLMDAEATLIIPLHTTYTGTGAVIFYRHRDTSFSPQTVKQCELFAILLSERLNWIQRQQLHQQELISIQHTMTAWEQFSGINTLLDIVETLQELTSTLSGVQASIVWLTSSESNSTPPVISATESRLKELFLSYCYEHDANSLLASTREYSYLRIRKEDYHSPDMAVLLNMFQVDDLMLMPIYYNGELYGGIILIRQPSQHIPVSQINYIRDFIRVAVNILHTTRLLDMMLEKSNRLETIMRVISEGLFFVDTDETVVFCNMQFTELSGLARHEVEEQPVFNLIEKLSERSQNASEVYEQMTEAIENVKQQNMEDYPVIELHPGHNSNPVYLELVRLESVFSDAGWVGLLRSYNTPGYNENIFPASGLLNEIASTLRQTRIEINNHVGKLHNYNNISVSQHDFILEKVQHNIESGWQLWNTFFELYQLENTSNTSPTVIVNLQEVLDNIFSSPIMKNYRDEVFTTLSSDLPRVELSHIHIKEQIRYVIQNLIELSPTRTLTDISIRIKSEECQIVMQNTNLKMTVDQFNYMINAPYHAALQVIKDYKVKVGFYLSCNVIRLSGTRIFAEQDTRGNPALIVALPINRNVEPEKKSSEESIIPYGTFRTATRSIRTIMVLKGTSQITTDVIEALQKQYDDVVICKSVEDAIWDIKNFRFDLILIDTMTADHNGLQNCAKMRQKTEIPIILLADDASQTDIVEGLKLGADDYITASASISEVMARVMVIFNRQTIADRTREPLSIGQLKINFAKRQVSKHNRPIKLTRIEYELLYIMVTNRGQVLTHERILSHVWGPESKDDKQYLWVNISRLRQKIESDSERYIFNEPGVGYYFAAE